MLERYRFLTIHFVSSEKTLGLIEMYSTLSNTLNTTLPLPRYNVGSKTSEHLKNKE
jgi:hypothetical protein